MLNSKSVADELTASGGGDELRVGAQVADELDARVGTNSRSAESASSSSVGRGQGSTDGRAEHDERLFEDKLN